MKRGIWLLLGFLPGVVWGDLLVARGWIAPALADFGDQEKASLVMTGTETVGLTTIPLAAELAVHRTLEPDLTYRYYFELRSWRDNVLTKRVVADGNRVWNYDARKHEYSVWQYDLEPGDRNRIPDRAALNMLRVVRKQFSGVEDLMMQTMIEAYEAQNGYSALLAKWLPWMPGSEVTLVGSGFRATTVSPRMTDMIYEISNPSAVEFYLLGIKFGRIEQREGSMLKTTLFDVTVNRGFYSATANFGFIPGTAKPVAVGLPQSGGG